jgi:hypothetical protein
MVRKKELVAYCGLYCGDCVKFKQNVSKLAKDLESELSSENFKKLAARIPGIKDYNEFSKVLKTITELKCNDSCRAGGGNPDCEVRLCCQKKGYFTCAECDEFLYCPELAGVPAIQCGIVAYVKELQRIKEIGLDAWLEEKENK